MPASVPFPSYFTLLLKTGLSRLGDGARNEAFFVFTSVCFGMAGLGICLYLFERKDLTLPASADPDRTEIERCGRLSVKYDARTFASSKSWGNNDVAVAMSLRDMRANPPLKEGANDSADTLLHFCTLLPKVEMHAHINGSIRDSTLLELMEAQNPSSEARELLLQTKVSAGNRRSLDDCFKLFGFIHSVVTSTGVVTRITRECIEDFCADNVKYVELRTTPKRSGNFTPRRYIDAVAEGIKVHLLCAGVPFIPHPN
jgi:hypothetical protein